MIFRAVLFIIAAIVVSVPAAAKKLKVVASFSIIGDLVQQVAASKIDLTTLVEPGTDAHTYEPTTADARAVAAADLVFINGIGIELWMPTVLGMNRWEVLSGNGNRWKKVVVAADGAAILPAHDHASDPHAWQNVRNTKVYVKNIALALATADPPNAEFYRSRSAAYLAELQTLETEIRAAIAVIPMARRRVLTNHDAFAYFGLAYDIEFTGALGLSTDDELSAKELATLIRQIRREKIRAVFLDGASDPRLIDTIARETGVKLGGTLYADTLSTTAGPAPTYLAMMRHNLKLLTAAMAHGS